MPDYSDELHQLAQELNSLSRTVQKVSDEIHRMHSRIRDFAIGKDPSSSASGGMRHGHLPAGVVRPAEAHKQQLLAEANVGAHVLSMDWQPDGSAFVSVNNGSSVPLSPLLAALLAILAARTGTDDGLLVGWKSRKQVLAQLDEKCGRGRRPRSLNQLVHRLRKTLESKGVNRFFVQTNPRAGLVRFVLQLRALPGPDPDDGSSKA